VLASDKPFSGRPHPHPCPRQAPRTGTSFS
jgi:hypothetical protein